MWSTPSEEPSMFMRMRRVIGLTFLCGFVWMTGCAHTPRAVGTDPSYSGGVFFERGGTVLTGAALQDGLGSVLAAMAGKVPNFRTQRQSGGCPLLSLRGRASFRSIANPHVYVDGTRATNTCILESLRTIDVTRVEVYPQGFTTRPGYGTHSYGLILVFMRSD